MEKQGSKKKKMTKMQVVIICVSLAFFFGFLPAASAHKVTVFAWVEDSMVYTESKLGGGKRVKDGDIFVYDEAGSLLLKGKTNDNGEFNFKLPIAPPLIVELNAGMGHLARWTIKVEDAGPSAFKDPVDETDIGKDGPGDRTPGDAASPMVGPAATQTMDMAELEITIERAVERSVGRSIDKKLKPVMTALSDMNQTDPSFSDIMGGIGYILGLVGIVAYFKSRQPKV